MFFAGIQSETLKFPASISQEELLAELRKLNMDDDIDGIIVQLPVPPHINERAVCNAIAAAKGFFSSLGENISSARYKFRDVFVICLFRFRC